MTLEAITKATMKFVSSETHLVRDHGPFQLRRIRPGVALGRTDDTGFGGLGLIDHARLQPGLALQLPFLKVSESMGNHDSNIVDAGSVD